MPIFKLEDNLYLDTMNIYNFHSYNKLSHSYFSSYIAEGRARSMLYYLKLLPTLRDYDLYLMLSS